MKRKKKRDKQAGRALERTRGDDGQILFPDGGARPLKVRYKRRRTKQEGGSHGSHLNGRHKLG